MHIQKYIGNVLLDINHLEHSSKKSLELIN